MRPTSTLLLLFCLLVSPTAAEDSPQLRRQAAETLRRATVFFRDHVATEGGYLWRYSKDLTKREGEGKATATTVWVQPPGTPTVGMAMLTAYEATGDTLYLDAARQAGYCLARGQLRSGGWDYRIEFDRAARRRYAYRVDPSDSSRKQRNTTTLDDDTTQAALRLLMRLDKTLDFKDATIHEAAESALRSLLAAQYPNGAWPQRFDKPPEAELYPVRKAGYPASWSRDWPKESYSQCYTFNDNAIADVIDVMFEAWRTYDNQKYLDAAKRGGDFILLAQMPEPQPAWAQQYDAEMHPVWARKFEPPAVTGGESQGVLRTLMQIYRQTGDPKYLEPIPRAIAYLRRSLLPDGRLARFYELKTNRPLFFTRDYELTYSDADMPTHYSFKIGSRLDRTEQEHERLKQLPPSELMPPQSPPGKPSSRLIEQVKSVIAALDDQGRWVDQGGLKHDDPDAPTSQIIDCRTFVENVRTLSEYLASMQGATSRRTDW